MKKILTIILVFVMILSIFSGCQSQEFDHVTLVSFSTEKEFKEYRKKLELKMNTYTTDNFLRSDIMLSQKDGYYAPSNYKDMTLDEIGIHEGYITTVYNIENVEGVNGNASSEDESVRCIWRQLSTDEAEGFFNNSVESGNMKKHDTLKNANYIEIKMVEDGETVSMHYELLINNQVFSIFVPLWLIDDMSDDELIKFLTPVKILF